MTDDAPRSSRCAIVSLTAGILGLAYAGFIVVLFWVSLSAFDSRMLTLAAPALLAGTAAIVLGLVSLRKHGWRLARSAAKPAVIGVAVWVFKCGLPAAEACIHRELHRQPAQL